MSLHVKKGDNVVVIAGKDKNKTGNIISANPSDNTVVVAGVNIIAKHQKPKKAGEKGGIMKHEGKIDASNVQVICPACGKATRVANKLDGDKKIRTCKKCGASLDVKVAKETKKATATKETTKAATTKKTATTKKATATKEVEKKTATKSTTTKTTTTKTAAKKTTKKSDKE